MRLGQQGYNSSDLSHFRNTWAETVTCRIYGRGEVLKYHHAGRKPSTAAPAIGTLSVC